MKQIMRVAKMKLATLATLFLALTTQMNSARASGCMWYDEYELGKIQIVTAITGTFTCEETIPGWSNCRFTSKDGQTVLSADQAVTAKLTPPLNQLIIVKASSYEAMHWQNCDGGDPVPPYVQNGTYDSFSYGGQKYSRFTNLTRDWPPTDEGLDEVNIMYNCRPDSANSPIKEITLSNQDGLECLLTVFSVNSLGQVAESRSKAHYYDDMTYFGYRSETLNLAIEFDFPETPHASFFMGQKIVPVTCVKKSRARE